MSKVNTSNRYRKRRQTGPDYRIKRSDIAPSMRNNSVLITIDHEKDKKNSFRKNIEYVINRIVLRNSGINK